MAAEGEAIVKAEKAMEGATSQVSERVGEAVQGVAQGDFTGALDLLKEYIVPIGSAVLFLLVGYMLAKFVSRIASAPVRKRVDETVGRFVGKLVFYSIMVFVLLGILGRFGISVASFAAVIAAAGFAVGLAFQGTLSNFASGVLLLVFRPFKVEDIVSAGGVTGKIYEIDLFTTTFDTFDNRRIIVPNSSIFGNTIENVTYHKERRVDVAVGCEYSASIPETRKVLEKAAESLKGFLVEGEGRGYQVFLSDLGDSSVNWKIRFWTKADDYWVVWEKLIEAAKRELDDAGIGIPFPQMDIHVADLPEGYSR